MVTITVLGIDSYFISQISQIATKKVADIYEISEDDVNFYSTEGFLVHKGSDQTQWNVIVKVSAPKKLSVLEKNVVKVLHEIIAKFCVNMEIFFEYYSQENYYQFLSPDHPHYVTDENEVNVTEEEVVEEEEEEVSGTDPYLGDVFEEFNKLVDKKEKEEHEHQCHCCDHDKN